MTALRVVIVDDHPMVVDGLTLALDVDGIEVVGTAGTAREAVEVVARTDPHVVIMDIHLPDASGLDATRELRQQHPDLSILILSMADDVHTATTALSVGANGYLVKGATRDDIVRAVQAVAGNQVILSAGIARAALPPTPPPPPPPPFPQLTARECEILDLLAAGHANPAIARRLGITPKTTANHVSNILLKLGVADRTQAALLAREALGPR
ncbi:response regulator transcription factor [Nocardia sp. CDC160]|uniref:response regulator transcription factor n=1 Tax=Nocardia sp. CDC160 TaxID=3112166 RepID=UPI002DBA3011|nr:response regulator transcription factor [Nocardia sp. CDC160]MEC3918155.1 response regulator transcription factor [Nocardia sp. CDC160]